MNISWILVLFGIIISVSWYVEGTTNSTRKRSSEDYYQINYDYEILNNNSLNVEFSSDSLILPIPDDSTVRDSTESSDKTEKILNGDLKEHDLIDSLMYIYHKHDHLDAPGRTASELIIGGCIFGTIAQISTTLFVALRYDVHYNKSLRNLFLHLMFSKIVANVAFIFGIYRTKYYLECLTVALALTYFHLMASVWIFIYCYHIYKVFCRKESVKRKYYYLYGYGLPFLFSLVSFLIAPQTYETRKFCFMSVQRGMIVNYMVPIFCLMVLTAFYCIKGIRLLSMELHILEANNSLDTLALYSTQMEVVMDKKRSHTSNSLTFPTSKSCLTNLCTMQTMYDIVWFFLVLALENAQEGGAMAFVYSLSSCVMNWYVFAHLLSFFPTVQKKPIMKQTTEKIAPKLCNVEENIDLSPTTSECKQGSSDSVPLLIDSTELKILYHNPNISTISS